MSKIRHRALPRGCVLTVLCLLCGAITRAQENPISVPMTADHWRPMGADSMGPKAEVQFLRKEGFPQGILIVKAGTTALNGLVFRDGTIDFDVKPLSQDAPGIQFRDRGPEGRQDGEEVYLRISGDCRASDDCVQYTPIVHGFMLWNVYPQYQHQAFVLDGWNHVRLTVSAHRLLVAINGQPEPALSVGELAGGSDEGELKLRGPAAFANLTVTPGATNNLPAEPAADPTAGDQGIVRRWQFSALTPLHAAPNPTYAQMPQDSKAWQQIDAERGGLVNLNRKYMAGDDPPSLGWLRFTVQASRPGAQRVSLGWIGQAWVFVNGRYVTQGKNFYYPEGERRDPDGRMSYENGSFDLPLRQGSNEVAIALYTSIHDDLRPRTSYGWGLMMRFLHPVQIRLAR